VRAASYQGRYAVSFPRALDHLQELGVVRERARVATLDAEPLPQNQIDVRAALPLRFVDELAHVLRREERRDLGEGREVQLALRDALEEKRKPPAHPRPGDVAIRGAVAHAKKAARVVPHRRCRREEVDATLLDLREEAERLHLLVALVEAASHELRDQRVVREMGE
jgi:hypothetical protein